MKVIATDKDGVGVLEHPRRADFNDRLNKRYYFLKDMVTRGAHPFKILGKFYEFLDKSLKEGYPPGTCKRGCSYCCHVAVEITLLEARYIEHKTGHKVTNPVDGPTNKNETRPCVFLKNNECSIYEHRPAVCRTFISFDDVKLCESAKTSHWMLALNPPGTGGFEWANLTYTQLIVSLLTREPKYRTKNDIRGFFGTG